MNELITKLLENVTESMEEGEIKQIIDIKSPSKVGRPVGSHIRTDAIAQEIIDQNKMNGVNTIRFYKSSFYRYNGKKWCPYLNSEFEGFVTSHLQAHYAESARV